MMVRYDLTELLTHQYWRWDGDDFAVLKYAPRRWGHPTSATDFVINFKNADPDAVTVVADALALVCGTQLARLGPAYVLAIPPSTQGQRNTACERVCAMLPQRVPWLTHIRAPFGLVRTASIQKSARAPRGERPGEADHFRTIAFRAPAGLDRGATFVMVDDVITRGATSGACRAILKVETRSPRILGLFVARTNYSRT